MLIVSKSYYKNFLRHFFLGEILVKEALILKEQKETEALMDWMEKKDLVDMMEYQVNFLNFFMLNSRKDPAFNYLFDKI